VLEVGCGFGRITKQLYENLRPSLYHAFDISSHQIENAQKNLGSSNVEFFVSSIEDFVPTRRYDLVLAVEVLMHIPPESISVTVRKLVDASTHFIVNLDWKVTDGVSSGNCFLHDYSSLYRALDCDVQVTRVKQPPLHWLIKSRKNDQSIFLATRRD
jgi:cyclopropane fatty-acyl-phospholipid synthase-like methyltransferase